MNIHLILLVQIPENRGTEEQKNRRAEEQKSRRTEEHKKEGREENLRRWLAQSSFSDDRRMKPGTKDWNAEPRLRKVYRQMPNVNCQMSKITNGAENPEPWPEKKRGRISTLNVINEAKTENPTPKNRGKNNGGFQR